MRLPWRRRLSALPDLGLSGAAALAPGAWLDSDLMVLDHLAGSHRVEVYLCRSKRLRRLVACKVLRPEFRARLSALEDLLHEGEVLLRLRHPNIVEGYGVALEGHPRIVMQYLPGQTVADAFLEGNGAAFSLAEKLDVVRQVGDALGYVHRRGFLHLDVKPTNVMYRDGRATLFDFNVAARWVPGEPLVDSAGTRDYMAPEQAGLRTLRPYTDVFGLGVLAYQLLAGGRLPYRSRAQTLSRPGEAERRLDYGIPPRSPSDLDPSVPPRVADVVLKALAPRPADRFPAPQAFVSALVDATDRAGFS